jgi:hypothetical protein
MFQLGMYVARSSVVSFFLHGCTATTTFFRFLGGAETGIIILQEVVFLETFDEKKQSSL